MLSLTGGSGDNTKFYVHFEDVNMFLSLYIVKVTFKKKQSLRLRGENVETIHFFL